MKTVTMTKRSIETPLLHLRRGDSESTAIRFRVPFDGGENKVSGMTWAVNISNYECEPFASYIGVPEEETEDAVIVYWDIPAKVSELSGRVFMELMGTDADGNVWKSGLHMIIVHCSLPECEIAEDEPARTALENFLAEAAERVNANMVETRQLARDLFENESAVRSESDTIMENKINEDVSDAKKYANDLVLQEAAARRTQYESIVGAHDEIIQKIYDESEARITGDSSTLDAAISAVNEINGEIRKDMLYEDEQIRKQIKNEQTERTVANTVLNARLKSIMQLPAGANAGDAEIADARVDVYGNTHAGLGIAIRSQVEGMNYEIRTINDIIENRITGEKDIEYETYSWTKKYVGHVRVENGETYRVWFKGAADNSAITNGYAWIYRSDGTQYAAKPIAGKDYTDVKVDIYDTFEFRVSCYTSAPATLHCYVEHLNAKNALERINERIDSEVSANGAENTAVRNMIRSVTGAINGKTGGHIGESPMFINSSLFWDAGGTHNIIMVEPGDTVYVKANRSYATYCSVLADYDAPKAKAKPKFSAIEGFNKRIAVSATKDSTFIIPDDGKYLVVNNTAGANTYYPEMLQINGINIKLNLREAMSGLQSNMKFVLGMNSERKAIDHGGIFTKKLYQNSPKSFKDSTAEGIRYHNIDIVFSSDRIPFVAHDNAWTDYVTGEQFSISALTAEQVKTHTVGDDDYNWTLQTLVETDRMIRCLGGVIDMVDVTGTGNKTANAAALGSYYMANNMNVAWTNFDDAASRDAFAAAAPGYGLYMVCSGDISSDPEQYLQTLIAFIRARPNTKFCINTGFNAVRGFIHDYLAGLNQLGVTLYAGVFNGNSGYLAADTQWAQGILSERFNANFVDWEYYSNV